jgi:SnoaL-like protein
VNSDQALPVVRRYHQSWTSRNYDQAIDLLAPTLTVEVPINDYPTVDSFAQALRGFGDLVQRIDLLCELSNGPEAMLLYDMQVNRLGRLRVAEHFTVTNGKITRLRQVHDTAPVRAAGLGPATDTPTGRSWHQQGGHTAVGVYLAPVHRAAGQSDDVALQAPHQTGVLPLACGRTVE